MGFFRSKSLCVQQKEEKILHLEILHDTYHSNPDVDIHFTPLVEQACSGGASRPMNVSSEEPLKWQQTLNIKYFRAPGKVLIIEIY